MTVKEILRRMPLLLVKGKGGIVLVFIGGEYAGSVERDEALGTWGAYALHRTDNPPVSEGMWGAIGALICQHVEGAIKAVLAR
jgi:hypothetical protein